MNRTFNSFGQPFGTDDQLVTRGAIPETESGQSVFTDGQGNKVYFATACAAASTITLPPAADTTDRQFTVKRKSATANALKVVATTGSVEGTPTYTILNQYDAPTFRSDGTNYYIVWEKAAVDTSTLLTSASASAKLTTSILNVVGSASFSRTANFRAGISVSGAANFLTTISVSGDADFRTTVSVSGAFNALTTMSVSGVATFKTSITVSATASVGALTIAGVPVTAPDFVKLGISFPTAAQSVVFSGSWSDYAAFQCFLTGIPQTAGINSFWVDLSADSGTSYFFSGRVASTSTVTATAFTASALVTGNGASPGKKLAGGLSMAISSNGNPATLLRASATANTGFINQIRFWVDQDGLATTNTLSTGFAYLMGMKA